MEAEIYPISYQDTQVTMDLQLEEIAAEPILSGAVKFVQPLPVDFIDRFMRVESECFCLKNQVKSLKLEQIQHIKAYNNITNILDKQNLIIEKQNLMLQNESLFPKKPEVFDSFTDINEEVNLSADKISLISSHSNSNVLKN